MESVYLKIWELARPYYEKARPSDIDHIEWIMRDAEIVCRKENLDESILLPLVILHDVGYAEIPNDKPFESNTREAHMKFGAEIAERILKEVGYSEEIAERVAYYVSVHDKWALGDNDVYKDKILGVFNDLDFTWMATPKGFPILMKILNKNHEEMIEYLEKDEKLILRPFSTASTKELFEKYLQERKSNNISQ